MVTSTLLYGVETWLVTQQDMLTEVNYTSKICNRKSKNPGRFNLGGLRQPRRLRGRKVLGFYSSCCIFCLYNWLPFICWCNIEPLQHQDMLRQLVTFYMDFQMSWGSVCGTCLRMLTSWRRLGIANCRAAEADSVTVVWPCQPKRKKRLQGVELPWDGFINVMYISTKFLTKLSNW